MKVSLIFILIFFTVQLNARNFFYIKEYDLIVRLFDTDSIATEVVNDPVNIDIWRPFSKSFFIRETVNGKEGSYRSYELAPEKKEIKAKVRNVSPKKESQKIKTIECFVLIRSDTMAYTLPPHRNSGESF